MRAEDREGGSTWSSFRFFGGGLLTASRELAEGVREIPSCLSRSRFRLMFSSLCDSILSTAMSFMITSLSKESLGNTATLLRVELKRKV